MSDSLVTTPLMRERDAAWYGILGVLKPHGCLALCHVHRRDPGLFPCNVTFSPKLEIVTG
jgi:hypothetical protein